MPTAISLLLGAEPVSCVPAEHREVSEGRARVTCASGLGRASGCGGGCSSAVPGNQEAQATKAGWGAARPSQCPLLAWHGT